MATLPWREKLQGRAFYESLGSPKFILAPMVDQSEFAWRLLTRSFLPAELRTSVLAYSPMLHAKLFAESPKYRASHFRPLRPSRSESAPETSEHSSTLGGGGGEEELYLDGNGNKDVGDRPLFVQFCANEADSFLEAAQAVAPFCDAVDLNLGCPQGIARKGRYGSFLQEDWATIHKLISTLHEKLEVPVTAKMRILETKEKTLEYAKMILGAGASILTVHGRLREQKGHNTGLADWSVIRYLREHLPPETVLFANGNVLQFEDLQRCLDETQADGVMSAEGNLYDPSIFAPPPPVGEEGPEYWRGRDGKGGYRADAVLRRYLDIIHRHVLGQEPPRRGPLFEIKGTTSSSSATDQPTVEGAPPNQSDPARDTHIRPDDSAGGDQGEDSVQQPPTKKQKKESAKQGKKSLKQEKCTNANLVAMQAHCFHMLRPLVSKHHGVREALARARAGDIDAYENVLALTEEAVKQGLEQYSADPTQFEEQVFDSSGDSKDERECSDEAVRRCRRPYWICQPHVRPLPKEAYEKGSLQLSKKEKARLTEMRRDDFGGVDEQVAVDVRSTPGGKAELADLIGNREYGDRAENEVTELEKLEVPRKGMVCG